MKAKVYHILHGIPTGDFMVEYTSDIVLETVEDVIKKAKRHFSMPGKQFTIVTDEATFHAYKDRNKWKVYELSPPKDKVKRLEDLVNKGIEDNEH